MRKFNSFNQDRIFLNQKIILFSLSFLVPALAFFLYFAGHHFNILTVDLGQQYVDFFAFFRKNLFRHPLSLIYSFQNGLGDSMLSTDAYYLLSPFNLLFFFFPLNELPFAILLVISLKIGAIGLSSFTYWQAKCPCFFALAASTAYALSGYVIANHFNLMWLDSLILLPFLIKAIDQLDCRPSKHLLLVTFFLWLTNFYTGLMALFFGFLYLLTRLPQIKRAKRGPHLLAYFKESCAGTLCAAFILLPVFFEMLASKAGMSPQWSFSWQFNPLFELTKLLPGSYNFQQMQTGMPNIYFTLPFTMLTILYFLSRQIAWPTKLANGLLLIFLLLSLFFTPLVLLWHLGQFPIWYPGRFSFVLIFDCLNLAITYLGKEEHIGVSQMIFLSLLGLALIAYCFSLQNKFSFLSKTALTIAALFTVLSLLYFLFSYNLHHSSFLLYFITVSEAISGMLLALNNLSYQENRDYQNFAQNMTQASQFLQRRDPTFYRSEKNFYRSDDDPLTADYCGLSSFNSTSNHQSLTFLSRLGYLHNSNSVTNNGGTPFSDALLGIKYYYLPQALNQAPTPQRMRFDNLNGRLDIFHNQQVASFKQLKIVKLKDSLPLLYLTPCPQASISLEPDAPLQNQQNLLKQALNSRQDYLTSVSWPRPKLKAVSQLQHSHSYIRLGGCHKVSEITFLLPLKKQRSYYLELPAGLEQTAMELLVNGQALNLAVRDSQDHLLNLAASPKAKQIKLTFLLKKKELNLSGVNLWAINMAKLKKSLHHFNKGQPHIYHPHPLEVTTSAFSSKKMRLASSIPASPNWLIFDHQHLLKQQNINHTFLGAHLAPGRHQLKLVYVPFAFLAGLLLSLTTVLLLKKFWH